MMILLGVYVCVGIFAIYAMVSSNLDSGFMAESWWLCIPKALLVAVLWPLIFAAFLIGFTIAILKGQNPFM